MEPFCVEAFSQADAYEDLLTTHSGECRVFCDLVGRMLVYGENAAACERGFSLMNRIKTSQRNRLSHDTLRDVMCIIACPIEPEQISYYDLIRNFNSVVLSDEA